MKKILVTIGFLLWIPGVFAADTIKAVVPPQIVLTAEGARFVYGQVSDFRSDQFLLDTKTGRMWKMVYDGETPLLQPVMYTPITPGAPRTPEPPPTK